MNIASGGGALCSVRRIAGIGLGAGCGIGLWVGGGIALGAGGVFLGRWLEVEMNCGLDV